MTTLYLLGTPARYRNYQRAVAAAGGQIRFRGNPESCDGLLLPGGGDMEPWRYGQKNTASRSLEPERDEAELRLLDSFVSCGKPVLGICRGLQVINVYFGGTLIQDLPGHSAASGTDRYHKVYTAPSLLETVCPSEMIVNSAHHQAADRLGSDLRAIQWAPDGTVEAICHGRLPVLAVQWHPERLAIGTEGDALLRLFLQLCRDGKNSGN